MKRLLCVAVAALMLIAGSANADSGYDFSELTLQELYEVRADLDAAIAALEDGDDSVFYEAGCYRVGADIPEGDYALLEREDAVFASVSVRAGKSVDSALILHKLVSGRADIHLEKDTWVTLSELRACPMGHEPPAIQPDGTVGEGAYLVGSQLSPGRYTVDREEKAPLSSYSVYTGIPGTQAQLIKFVVLREAVELDLSAGEYLELSGCILYPEAP